MIHLTLSNAVAALALIVAALSLFIAWRTYRRNALAERPTVQAFLTPIKDQPDWRDAQAHEKTPPSPPPLKNPLPVDLGVRRYRSHLRVTEAGVRAPRLGNIPLGWGEHCDETVWVHAPRRWPCRRMIVRLTMDSDEGIARRVARWIVRPLT